jgi:hypothetical protein
MRTPRAFQDICLTLKACGSLATRLILEARPGSGMLCSLKLSLACDSHTAATSYLCPMSQSKKSLAYLPCILSFRATTSKKAEEADAVSMSWTVFASFSTPWKPLLRSPMLSIPARRPHQRLLRARLVFHRPDSAIAPHFRWCHDARPGRRHRGSPAQMPRQAVP